MAVGFIVILLALSPVIPGPLANGYRNECILNLRQLKAAKESAALELDWTNGTPVAEGDTNVNYYIKGLAGGGLPACPGGGRYTYNPVGRSPTCTIPEHRLPKQ